jgi:hypothetical protein
MGARNLIWGLVVLLLGLQLRTVESYVLTPKASRFVEEKLSSDQLLSTDDPFGSYQSRSYDSLSPSAGPITPKRVTPPRWLGWAMISLGAILVLHGLTTKT